MYMLIIPDQLALDHLVDSTKRYHYSSLYRLVDLLREKPIF